MYSFPVTQGKLWLELQECNEGYKEQEYVLF